MLLIIIIIIIDSVVVIIVFISIIIIIISSSIVAITTLSRKDPSILEYLFVVEPYIVVIIWHVITCVYYWFLL